METNCQEQSKSSNATTSDNHRSNFDRKITKLKEKLASIQSLKDQQKNGKKLEKNQIDKIEREKEFKFELEKLEAQKQD